MIKIKDITKRDKVYSIIFEKDNELFLIKGNMILTNLNGEQVDDHIHELLGEHNFLTKDITDEVYISQDEHLTVITKLREVEPTDLIIPLGDVRYIVEYHHDSTYMLSFVVNSCNCQDLDMNEFSLALFNYLDWDR